MVLITKPKPKKCKQCPCTFMPTAPMQSVCSRACERARAAEKAKSKPKKGFQSKKHQGIDAHIIDVEAHIIDGDERFVQQDDARHAARAARQLASAAETRELVALVGVVALVSQDEPSCAAIEKDGAVEHKGYQKLVAALPCSWCGIYGRSNHAHENGIANGKGMGLKVDDRRAMPLCVDDMGKHGCHTTFDRYALIDGGKEAHAELGRILSARTRKIIRDAGGWPKGLPYLEEDD